MKKMMLCVVMVLCIAGEAMAGDAAVYGLLGGLQGLGSAMAGSDGRDFRAERREREAWEDHQRRLEYQQREMERFQAHQDDENRQAIQIMNGKRNRGFLENWSEYK